MHHKWQSYNAWFLRYEVQQTGFFVILDHFLLFYHPMDPANQNIAKMKKKPQGIIILHMCIIDDNHMMYGSWDMKRKRQNFLSFWTVFCHFTPPNNPKNQNFEKLNKKTWRYHFTNVYHKGQSYDVWFLRNWMWQIAFLSFWTIFCPFTSSPDNLKYQTFEKI